jgi:hypothetical protein
MDLSPIIVVAVILLAAGGTGRVLAQLGLASDLMASLFVPPDRALGWPHGVQEQDAPWRWRPPAASVATTDGSDSAGPVPTQRIAPLIGRGSALPGGPRVRR